MPSSLKIKLLFELKNGPFGGGNQFLKAIRKELAKKNVLFVDNPKEADVFLAITYHHLLEAVKLKRLYPDKKLIFRLGDVFRHHRGSRWKTMDRIIALTASASDGAILQSNWSLKEAQKMGFRNNNFTIIHNAVDPVLFNSENKLPHSGKTKLIAVSWSQNKNKGFSFYKFIDDHLDFNKYEMTFIGHSPVEFKNIIQLPPLESSRVSAYLKKSDLFISASQLEACSNSILEALSSNLPVLALNSGSHPEIIKNRGELFNSEKELLVKINEMSANLEKYKKGEKPESLSIVADKYLNFINHSPLKKINFLSLLKIKFLLKLFNLRK